MAEARDLCALLSRAAAAMLREDEPVALLQEVCAACVADACFAGAAATLIEGDVPRIVARAGAPIEAADVIAQAVASGTRAESAPAADSSGRSYAFALRRDDVVAGALAVAVEATACDEAALRALDALAANLGLALAHLERDARRRRDIDEARHGVDRFHKIFDATPVATVIATMAEGRLVAVNDAYCTFMGRPREALLGRTTLELDAWLEAAARERFVAEVARRHRVREQEQQVRAAGGEVRDVLMSAELLDFGGQPCMLTILNDITARKRYERQIRFLATHDGLTGLPNRTLLHDRLVQALMHARRAGTHLVVLYVDVDRFKTVNEALGQRGGDAVLTELAARMRRSVRDGATVARMGGDEFVVLGTDFASLSDCYNLVQRLQAELSAPVTFERHTLHLTASIGGSAFPGDGDAAEVLLQHAEAAMLGAKRIRPGTAQFATPEMSAELRRVAQLEAQLYGALAAGQLRLVYQPKIEVASGRIAGTEALLRWEHPELGEVPPASFIPVAEEAGAVIAIGAWALHAACRQNMEWQADGLPPLPVSVNVSARQFLQPDLVSTVAGALEASGMPGHLLEIEITETVFARNTERILDIMSLLRELGVRFSIDDFGTGYSSLGYLRRFRLDGLKIDQSFVRNVDRDPGDAAIALAVIAMARTLDLEVTAEGVENAAQYAFMKRNHCDEVQGFYFSGPVEADAFARMVREGRRLH